MLISVLTPENNGCLHLTKRKKRPLSCLRVLAIPKGIYTYQFRVKTRYFRQFYVARMIGEDLHPLWADSVAVVEFDIKPIRLDIWRCKNNEDPDRA
jgi:hypothetical protein